MEQNVFSAFDRIVIDVANPAEANASYSALLGKSGCGDTFKLGNVWATLRQSSDATVPHHRETATQSRVAKKPRRGRADS